MATFQAAPQFIRHSGIAAPFLRPDVEGELIAPVGPELHDLHAVHTDRSTVSLAAHPHDGSWHGQHAFQGWRYRIDGSEDPDFVLNQAPYRRASILIAGRNFGQGSLQGYGVVRLMQCGMRVVIAPSFGPVFHDDCFDYGLLPVTLPEDVVQRIADQVAAAPEVETTVDLVGRRVERPGMEALEFHIDPRRRVSLLSGSNSTLDERLEHADSAAAKRAQDQQARPWIYDTRGNPNPE
jgi:3-isopropylmalate/(R)-2-methylmalate dehydratase small subunit